MYCKLFASLYQGTLRGRAHDILVFTNLLAHADKEGFVDKHWKAIAEEVGLTIEEVKAACNRLESPDEESRSKELDGARIERIDDHRAWGWRVVNYVKYRTIRDCEDRREQNRLAQSRWRSKRKPQSAIVSQDKPESAHADADADADLSLNVKGKEGMGENPCNAVTPSRHGVTLPSVTEEGVKVVNAPKGAFRAFAGSAAAKQVPVPCGTPEEVFQRELCQLFGRSETDRWSYAEEHAMAEVARRPDFMAEFEQLKVYKARNRAYFPRSIESLLSNWSKHLDSARNHVTPEGLKRASELLRRIDE